MPILGYLDDLVLVPLGIALAVRMIPDSVLAESRANAAEAFAGVKPVSKTAAVIVVAIWLIAGGLCAVWLLRLGTR